jgi:hypothetical protein
MHTLGTTQWPQHAKFSPHKLPLRQNLKSDERYYRRNHYNLGSSPLFFCVSTLSTLSRSGVSHLCDLDKAIDFAEKPFDNGSSVG